MTSRAIRKFTSHMMKYFEVGDRNSRKYSGLATLSLTVYAAETTDISTEQLAIAELVTLNQVWFIEKTDDHLTLRALHPVVN